METTANYLTGERMFFSSDERKWVNKIRRLKSEHPEEVEILREPGENDGCIYCSLPSQWLKLTPKRNIVMTDEQRAAAAERFRAFREKGNHETDTSLQELSEEDDELPLDLS